MMRVGLRPYSVVGVAKVQEEVRMTLLIAKRQAMGAGDTLAPQLLGGLPRELLQAVLFGISSQRQPSPERWALINEGDDGLPNDWRSHTFDLSVPPAS
jgi:hypothetical protein